MRFLFLIGVVLLLPKVLLAQLEEKRFGLGLIVGVTAAQIDGDDLQGYDKTGFLGGIRSIAHISDVLDFSTELLYSERGSISKNQDSQTKFTQIDLAYAEVAFLINVKGWYNPFKKIYRAEVSGGISVGGLIQAQTMQRGGHSDFTLADMEEEFATRDLSLKLGVSYFITENFGTSVRFNRSLTKLFDREKSPLKDLGAKNFISYHMSLQLFYLL